MHRYSEEEKAFFEEFVKGHSYKEIAEEHNNRFEHQISETQAGSYCSHHELKTGTQTKFQKGNIPFNKGKKGICAKGSEKGWFKKGNMPKNHREVGSERITRDGYIEIKIAEPNKWELKHRVVYENEYGPIPKGTAIIFLDGDKLNCDIDNLRIIDRADNARLNQSGLRSNIPEFTETGILIAKTLTAIGKKKRGKVNVERNTEN